MNPKSLKKAMLFTLCTFFCFQGHASEIQSILDSAFRDMLKIALMVVAVIVVFVLTIRFFMRKPR